MKKDKRYKIAYRGYRYAPESIEVFNHGKRIRFKHRDNAGYYAIVDHEKFLNEVKREIRAQQKEPRYRYTIGFKTSLNNIVYFSHRAGFDRFDIYNLLHDYRYLKEYFQERNWKYEHIKIEKGEMFTGKQEEYYEEEIVIPKPILIKLKIEE